MLRVFLDPYVLAVPKPGPDPATAARQLNNYAKRLIELNDARAEGFGTLFLPRDVESVLFSTSSYPLWSNLEAALAAANLCDVYQPQDIVAIVDGFLKQIQRVEDELRIEELLAELAAIDPDSHLNLYPAELADSHRNLLLLVALLLRGCGSSCCGDMVVATDSGDATRTIRVQGAIDDWTLAENSPCRHLVLPVCLDAHLVVVSSWPELLQLIDPIEIWRAANTPSVLNMGFRKFLQRFASLNGISQSVVLTSSWAFGQSFIASIEPLGFSHDRPKIQRLLTAMAEVVLELNMNQVHKLRTGKGANEPQAKRNKDGAWRRDIDYEFHLHYWSTSKGAEFASVVVHNDFSIPT